MCTNTQPSPDTGPLPQRPLRCAEGPFRLQVHQRVLSAGREPSDPARLFERIRALRPGRRGAMLLESADRSGVDGRFSLLFPTPSVRLVVRRGKARLTALDARGRRLLSAFGGAGGAERVMVPVPMPIADPGAADRERLRSPSALDLVRRLVRTSIDEPRTSAAVPVTIAGSFAYDLVDHFEVLPDRPSASTDHDIDALLCLDAIRVDHDNGEIALVTRSLAGGDHDQAAQARDRLDRWEAEIGHAESVALAPVNDSIELTVRADRTPAEFCAGVERLLEHIRSGDVFQAVLSRALAVASDVSPDRVYARLRAANPSPYMFFVELEDGELIGASPETCLRVRGDELMVSPIAGTAARGRRPGGELDADLDSRLAVQLMLDPKEQAEHTMLVDLARNDVARVAVPGTRTVSAPMTIERYSHVQHLVSRIIGRLDPALDALDAYRAVANMGTLTGAPKLRAMEIVRQCEPTSRGVYGGAVFHLSAEGEFDSCIVIRSLRRRGSTYGVRAGAGIVLDSDPQRELAETEHKARAPLAALQAAIAEQERVR